MIWHITTAALAASVAFRAGWQAATRHHARCLRDVCNYDAADLIAPRTGGTP